MNTGDSVVAAFDFDGTLIRGDAVAGFLREAAGRRRMVKAIAANLPGLLAVAIGRGDRDRVKAAMVQQILCGLRVTTIDELGERYADRLQSRLRADTVARLRWHQANGHRCLIVSASLEPYLRPLGRALGIDDVLCTRLEVRDGQLTGALDGGNCRGPDKARRLAGFRSGATTIYAYGDSNGDREMLAMADHPMNVHRVLVTASPDPA